MRKVRDRVRGAVGGRVARRQLSKNRVQGARPKIKRANRDKKLSQQQIILLGIGSGVALGLGYWAYTHFRDRSAKRFGVNDPIIIPTSDITTKPTSPATDVGSFPLKIGSRGTLVKMVQEALLARGGQAAMIIRETSYRGGKVDGIFGLGTQKALRAAGLPSALTQTQFTSLVGKGKSSPFGGWGTLAKELIDATNKRNLFGVLQGLRKMKSVEDYRAVSTYFQNIRITGTRVTSLVNALLSVAFANKEFEKVKIRSEFRRMGLKQNSSGVWFIPNAIGNLGPFENQQDRIQNEWDLAIASRPTFLKSSDGSVIVPDVVPDTVIGYITGMQNGITRILTQTGETVYAPNRNLYSI